MAVEPASAQTAISASRSDTVPLWFLLAAQFLVAAAGLVVEIVAGRMLAPYVGMSLYTKRLEAGKFIWPTSGSGEAVQISAAQLGYLLEGIDWRNPRWTQRPAKAG